MPLLSAGDSEPPTRAPWIASENEGKALTGLTVLVVEDEALLAYMLCESLERMGVEVIGSAATAADAIALATKHRPDLVLMDITLRGSDDGVYAATIIRQRLTTRIVFLTAHSDPATRARVAAVVPDGFLSKPYTDSELQRAIHAAVSSPRSGRQ